MKLSSKHGTVQKPLSSAEKSSHSQIIPLPRQVMSQTLSTLTTLIYSHTSSQTTLISLTTLITLYHCTLEICLAQNSSLLAVHTSPYLIAILELMLCGSTDPVVKHSSP